MFYDYPVLKMAGIVDRSGPDQKYYLTFAVLRQFFAIILGLNP